MGWKQITDPEELQLLGEAGLLWCNYNIPHPHEDDYRLESAEWWSYSGRSIAWARHQKTYNFYIRLEE